MLSGIWSILSDSRQASVIFVEAKFVSKHGVESSVGTVTLKRAPRKRSVIADEPTLNDLLGRILRSRT